MKWLVLLLAVLALAWLLTGTWRRLRQRDDPPARRPAPQVEGMVACAHCGVHLPASLALPGGGARGEHYCSTAHRDAGPRPR